MITDPSEELPASYIPPLTSQSTVDSRAGVTSLFPNESAFNAATKTTDFTRIGTELPLSILGTLDESVQQMSDQVWLEVSNQEVLHFSYGFKDELDTEYRCSRWWWKPEGLPRFRVAQAVHYAVLDDEVNLAMEFRLYPVHRKVVVFLKHILRDHPEQAMELLSIKLSGPYRGNIIAHVHQCILVIDNVLARIKSQEIGFEHYQVDSLSELSMARFRELIRRVLLAALHDMEENEDSQH